ncbi:MAG: site-specific DNA-methyltransferase [Bacteroidota bacterium]
MDPAHLGLKVLARHGTGDDNLLIRGDNLPVMRSLLPALAGTVKLVYIDPPFNTGGRFAHYRDDLDSEAWLAMMEARLPLLRDFLRPDGVIFVHLDDAELAYCKVILDRIFGRRNYITTVVLQAATPSSFKTVNPGPADVTEYLLMFCRDREHFRYRPFFVPCRQVDLHRFSRYIVNPEEPPSRWRFESVTQAALAELGFTGPPLAARAEARRLLGAEKARLILSQRAEAFALAHAETVFETKTLQRPGRRLAEAVAKSKMTAGVLRVPRTGRPDLYLYRGRQLYFLAQSMRQFSEGPALAQPLSNLWTDIPTCNLYSEGGVSFRYGKKPERLLERLLQLATDPGDYVLDAFAGSGTTGAVAQKLGRRWLMIESGPQAETHAYRRLCRVTDGEDRTGISVSTRWQGGGGFVYCALGEEVETAETLHDAGRPSADAAPPTIVTAAIIRRANLYLMTQRADNHLWEFPGGKLEPGEDTRDGLRREIREELGLEIEVDQPLEVVTLARPRALVLIFFAARIAAGEPRLIEGADLRWVDAENLLALPMGEADRRVAEKMASRDTGEKHLHGV